MNKLSLSLVCLLTGFTLVSACSPEKSTDSQAQDPHANHSPETSENAHAHHQEMEAADPSDQSIYLLNSEWNTHTGQPLKLKAFAGRPLVLAMVYASCKNACPRIIVDMKKIQAESETQHPGETRFVLVSIDPEVDTPAKLAELAQKSKLDGQWELLQGSPDDVRELAAVLGVKYRKISATDYAHSNLISVLNPKGEIIHRQMGLGLEPEETLQALNKIY